MLPTWCRDATLFCGMALLSVGIGLLLNLQRAKPLALPHLSKLDRLNLAIANLNLGESHEAGATSSAREITLDEFREMSRSSSALIVDTRPDAFYALGHVPGAISLSRETFAAGYIRHQTRLERQKELPVLLYCSGGLCEESHLIASGLQRLGFRDLYVFIGGWREWQEARLAEER